MNVDIELEIWRRQWQSDTAVPLDLRRKVERQSRLMRIALIAPILVTITIGGAMAAWAVRAPQPNNILLAVWTWILIAVAWTFGLRVDRGNWSPSAEDAVVFVDLSLRRCRAKLSSIRFAAGFFLVQIVFVLGWVYNNSPVRGTPLLTWLFFSSIPIDAVWLCTVVFFGFLIWYRRRKLAELAYFLSLREDYARSLDLTGEHKNPGAS
jgi:hypothetical protein